MGKRNRLFLGSYHLSRKRKRINHSETKKRNVDLESQNFTPDKNAVVIWGKLIKRISKNEYNQMKSEYYDEDEYLIKTDITSEVKLMGNKKIPTHIEIIPADEPNHKTIVDINSMVFDIPISDNAEFDVLAQTFGGKLKNSVTENTEFKQITFAFLQFKYNF